MRLITDEQHAQFVDALSDERYVSQYSQIVEALATLQALPEVEVVAWRTMESDEKKPKRLDEWFYAENKAYTEVHKFKWMPLYATKEPK